MPLADVSSRYADLVESVFSTAIAGKVWLATGAFVLAFVQVLTASRMWGKLERFVPVSFLDVATDPSLVGPDRSPAHAPGDLPLRHDPRLRDHRPAGHGALDRRLLHLRRRRGEAARDPAPSRNYPPWVLPVLGGTLAAVLTTLWLTSSLWYFTNVRFGL